MKRMALLAFLLVCVVCCGEEQGAFAAPEILKPEENAAVAARPFGPSLIPAQSANAVDKARNERYYALGLAELRKERTWRAIDAFSEAIAADRADKRAYLARGDALRIFSENERVHVRELANVLASFSEDYIFSPPRPSARPIMPGAETYEKKRQTYVDFVTQGRGVLMDSCRVALRDYNRALALGTDSAEEVRLLRGRGATYGVLAMHAGDVLRFAREEQNNFRLLDLCEPQNHARRLNWPRLDKAIYAGAAAVIEAHAAKALADYDEALRRAPNDAAAYEGRGDVYDALGRYRLLEAGAPSGYWADRFVRRARPDAAPRFELSDYECALADYERAAARSPEPAPLWFKLGDLHARSYDDAQAFAAYGRAVDSPKTREAALYRRSGLYFSGGNQDAFGADMGKYLNKHPDASYAAQFMFHLDRLKNKIEEITEATDNIAVAPTDGKYYAYRAERWRQCRRFSQAAADYTRAIELGEPAAALYWRRGECRRELRQWRAALADYAAAEALGYLQQSLSQSNVQTKARQARGLYADINLYDEILTKASENEATQFYIGRAIANFGARQYAGAAWDYTRAIRDEPELPELYFRRALAHNNMNLRHLAAADFLLITLRYPKNKDAYQWLIWLYEKVLREDVKAVACYDKLLALDSHDRWDYFKRAVILDRLGEEEKAAADFKTWAKGMPAERYAEGYKEIPEKYRAMLPPVKNSNRK